MSRLLILLYLFLITTSFNALAQDNSRWEIYGLASNLNVSTPPGDSGAAGFRIGGEWRGAPNFSLVADIGHNFVSDQHEAFTSFLAGPRLYSNEFRLIAPRFRPHKQLSIPASGFVQFLAGTQRSTQQGQPANWSTTIAPGGGFDIRLGNHLTFRLIEVELMFPGGVLTGRSSSGFAYRFGH